MAPVASGITNTYNQKFSLILSLLKSSVAPRVPIDWILSMLLDNSEEKDDSSDQLLLGLAAGLLMASENKQSSFFFSSTNQATTSTQSFAGPQEVNAAYNTELPAVAADPSAATDATAQNPSSQVPKIDTTG